MLAIACAAAYGGFRLYRSSQDRVVDVCIVTDLPYRVDFGEQPWDTKARLLGRFQEVNNLFAGTGVQWNATYGGDAFGKQAPVGLEGRRVRLAEFPPCQADVVVAFVGGLEGAGTTSVSPFSHSLVVSEKRSDADGIKTMALARGLATLFGVAINTRVLVAIDSPDGTLFDDRTKATIHALRNYDFARGIGALEGKWESIAAKALTEGLTGKDPHPSAEAHRILARTFSVAVKHSRAVAHLREAIRDDPSNQALRLELGLALKDDSQVDAAIVELEAAARMDPSDARPHAVMGAMYLVSRRPYHAIDELRLAVQLDHQVPEYQAALGRALAAQAGNDVEAQAAFDDALRMDPKDPLARAGAHAIAQKAETARDWVGEAQAELKSRPASADAHYQLGLAQLMSGRLDLAEKEFRVALAIEPTLGNAHTALAHIHYQRQEFPVAEVELRAAAAAGATIPAGFADAVKRKLAAPKAN